MIIETAALISFGGWLTEKLAEKGFDEFYEKLLRIDENGKFYQVVKTTSDEMGEKYPEVMGGSIDHFFTQEEVFSELVKFLFADSKVDEGTVSSQFDIETLPTGFVTEFIGRLRTNLLRDEEFRGILMNKEIHMSCIGIANDVADILKLTTMSVQEISSIREMLQTHFKNEFDFKSFKNRYFTNAENNLSQVHHIGLGVDLNIEKGKRKVIKQIFVKPVFSFSDFTKNRRHENVILEFKKNRIFYKELMSISKNLVILGNPGSGKSFLIKSIICSIVNSISDEFKNKEICNYIPFRIELRKYIALKKERHLSLLPYLSLLLEQEYSVSNITPEVLEKIIHSKKSIFFFDGLDEIFDINDKLSVKNDIENFVENFDNVLSITTSRIEGYEEACLNPEKFIEIKIDKFDEKQIGEYLNKWYEIEEDVVEVREKEISDFLSKKKGLDDELLTNPLLLSLIVILYRNNLKLPESKLEIYQSCTSTLVDKWDTSKDLEIDLDNDILKRKETILADLAYWQYTEVSKEAPLRITYERAKNVVGDCMHVKLKLVDEFSIERSAEKFMNYIQKRSIYFDNNFTHKTFLEYYTAYWIYTNIEKKHKKDERNSIIGKYIDATFWHIVLELLINLIDKDQADDEMMDEMFEEQLLNPDKSVNFLISVLPTVRNVSAVTVQKVIISVVASLVRNDNFDGRSQLFHKLNDLNQITRFTSIVTRVIEANVEINPKNALIACQLLLQLYFLKSVPPEIETLLVALDVEELSKKDSFVFLASRWGSLKVNEEDILEDLKKYVAYFGIDSSRKFTRMNFIGARFVPIFYSAIDNCMKFGSLLELDKNIRVVVSLGYSTEDILTALFSRSTHLADLDSSIIIDSINGINESTLTETEIILVGLILHLDEMGFEADGTGSIDIASLAEPKIQNILSKSREVRGSVLEFLVNEFSLDSKIIKPTIDEFP